MEEENNPIRSLIEMMEKNRITSEKLGEIGKEERAKAERQILMDLWGWAENNTETYSEAFQVIATYNKALRKTREYLLECHPPAMAKLSESLSSHLAADAVMIRRMDDAMSKIDDSQND
jgi:hypothetical protein